MLLDIGTNPSFPYDQKVLFILSDGDLGITKSLYIITNQNPRCLCYEEDPSWSEGARVMFQMSSTMSNTDTRISQLIDYGWELAMLLVCSG